MMSVMKKIILIIVILMLLTSIIGTETFATGAFDPGRFEVGNPGDAETMTTSLLGAVLSVVRLIAVSIGFVMIVILGIKYMTSSASERAEIKKHAVIYVVGAIMLFAGAGILSIIIEFTSNIRP